MSYKLVIFTTDFLVYLLVLMACIFFLWARKKIYWRNAWDRVINKPAAVITLTILFFYLIIALLDSVHFQKALTSLPGQSKIYSQQIQSVLDVLVSPVGQRFEKTYSAPFATHLYNQDVIQLSDGKFTQAYVPLTNLVKSDRSKGSEIFLRSLLGLINAILVIVVISVFMLFWMLHKKKFHWSRTKTIFIVTLSIVLSCIFIMHELSKAFYIFGTDKVGQDVFYVCIKSIRTGVLIGTLTTLVMLPFALLLGMMAGYFGGFIDDVIQYIYTTLSSIPAVLLIAASILSIQIFIANHPGLFRNLAAQADARLLALCIILGITSWTSLCRFLRAETLKLREMDYISAAKVLGVSHFSILLKHILPNVMHIVIITVVLDFSGLVLAEAVLSYVGIGVDPTMMSWGNMINSARLELAREPVVWWPLLAAFIFMFILVLSANIFSDKLRDAFDPKLRLE